MKGGALCAAWSIPIGDVLGRLFIYRSDRLHMSSDHPATKPSFQLIMGQLETHLGVEAATPGEFRWC